MRVNRQKFYFAAPFLEFVNSRIPGDPYGVLADSAGGPPSHILDVCGGTGYAAGILSHRFANAEVTSLDLSPELSRAGPRYRRRGASGDQVRFVVGDATKMPFGDSSFDLVVSAFALHELSAGDRFRVFREVNRVMTVAGHFCVIDIDRPYRGRRLHGAYLFASHGRDAGGVLGRGLERQARLCGFEVVERHGSLGKGFRFQFIKFRHRS